MEEQFSQLSKTAQSAIQSAKDLAELQALKVRFLGKKGELTQLLKQVGRLPAEEKPKIGQKVNQIKQTLNQLFDERWRELTALSIKNQIANETIDITLAGRKNRLGSLHPVTQVRERIIDIFDKMGFSVAEGPEIEDDYHNFTALNIPPLHPARAMQDTFYFGDGRLLRTHTSPVQIRQMKASGVPIRLITAGRVYRRDSDQTHTPMFHQLEGLCIGDSICFAELKGVLHHFLNAFFDKDLQLRFRPSFFPFTEPSAEVDIYQPETDSYLEVLGCGMVHPNVLKQVGVDAERYSGYAFGVGLDRLAMLRYQIPDLRLLFENDIRFLQQF